MPVGVSAEAFLLAFFLLVAPVPRWSVTSLLLALFSRFIGTVLLLLIQPKNFLFHFDNSRCIGPSESLSPARGSCVKSLNLMLSGAVLVDKVGVLGLGGAVPEGLG